MTELIDLFDQRPTTTAFELYDYQQQGVDNIRNTIRQGVRRLVVEAPTGAGKTKIAADLALGARQKQKRQAFVVPAISLVDQTVEEFYRNGITDIGVIQADHHLQDWSKPIQICSIQTIEKRGAYPDVQSVIFDECHELHGAHKRWMTSAGWENIPFIGLSATPWSKGLGNYFETKLTVATIGELIERGFLSKFRCFAASHPDLKGVKQVKADGDDVADFHNGQLSDAMNKSGLCADIVSTYKQLWGKGRTLCFAVDRAHAVSLQERFKFAGVKCGYQDANTPQDDRAVIRKMFHDGSYEVVVSVDTLSRGIDWDVRCIILARPTKSEIKYAQIIGRGLRLAPRGADPKDELIILDHSDTTGNLGFVTDIHHESLDCAKTPIKRGKQQPKEKLPVECEKCTALYKANFERKCPNCGHVTKMQTAILEDEGELQEVKRDGSLFKARKVPAKDWSVEERKQFLSELKAYAEMSGYKPGWAAAKYKDKFKDWPPRDWDRIRPAAVISPTMAAWVKSRNIAWARSKRRNDNAARS